MTIGLITCGALAWEVRSLIEKNSWDAEMIGIPAVDHVFPERIAPDVKKQIQKNLDRYDDLIVLYGDCGSKGALDEMLKEFPEIHRLPGPHCYHFYAGDTFQEIINQEPGSYFLTDFMIRTFEGLIKKSMGLDRFPELTEDYFRNYRQVVYLAQTTDPALRKKAELIAAELGLPLIIQETGMELFEACLQAAISNLRL